MKNELIVLIIKVGGQSVADQIVVIFVPPFLAHLENKNTIKKFSEAHIII